MFRLKNKNLFLLIFIFILLPFSARNAGAQTASVQKKTAAAIKKEALSKETVQDSIEYLKKAVDQAASNSDRRSLLYFLGNIQEETGLYTDASRSYAKAAGIAAPDAEGFVKINAENLVLAAVRTALLSGDYETADSYLGSAVRNSKDPAVKAYVNLYGAWSNLCRASDYKETLDTVELLKAYAVMDLMKPVRPQVLFTVWYITGENSYAQTLTSQYPQSPEAKIVNGSAQIASVPFWYFVPRAGAVSSVTENSVAKSGSPLNAESNVGQKTEVKSGEKTDLKQSDDGFERKKSSVTKQQLGLYKSRENAVALIKRVREKGFDAYYYTEIRASGTTYFIVVVDDSTKSLCKKLTQAGFDCYPVD